MDERYSDDRSPGGGGHGGGNAGRWLVSYADFVTLMFVVFVVLFSMAKLDSSKYAQLKESLGQGFGVQPLPTGGNPVNTAPVKPGPDADSAPGALNPIGTEPVVPAPPAPALVPPEATEPSATEPVAEAPAAEPEPEPAPKPVDPMAAVEEGFKATFAARAGQLDVTLQDRGVIVSVLTSVLFAEGESVLKPDAGQILDQISGQLAATTQSVLVEGAPDASDKQAPWDLSSRRASAVVGYLVNTHGLAPERFSVIGYGKGAGVDGIVNVVVMRRP
ncbi:MAG TPA: flagellar motor protein MotB [Symbiobacteriaceae bacterium]|nr:flagellar motor protein MotB [Symbiobacteriaceae bacterium]